MVVFVDLVGDEYLWAGGKVYIVATWARVYAARGTVFSMGMLGRVVLCRVFVLSGIVKVVYVAACSR